jgi:hypothetical protein
MNSDYCLPKRNTIPALWRKLFCRLLAPSGNFIKKILGLNGTDCKVAQHGDIDAASTRRPKSRLRSQHNRIRRPDCPQKNLDKRRNPPAPEIRSSGAFFFVGSSRRRGGPRRYVAQL